MSFRNVNDILLAGIEVNQTGNIYTILKIGNDPIFHIIIQRRIGKQDGPVINQCVYYPNDLRILYTNLYRLRCVLYFHKNKYNHTAEIILFPSKNSLLKITNYLRNTISKQNKSTCRFFDVL